MKMKKTSFQECIEHIRGLNKEDIKRLKEEADDLLGKNTKIVIPESTNKTVDDLKEKWIKDQEEITKKHNILLQNIKKNMSKLEELWSEVTDHWGEEDLVYRFYHQSFKVYDIQAVTEEIFRALMELHYEKDGKLDDYFTSIFLEGTCRNRGWDHSHNLIWATTTRPFLEAFFHAKYFLQMAIKYGKELNEAPNCLPSGWASLLCLYRLR